MNGAADRRHAHPGAHVGEKIVIAPAAGHLRRPSPRLDLEDEAGVVFEIAPEGRREMEASRPAKAELLHLRRCAVAKRVAARLEALAMAHGAAGGECCIGLALDREIIVDASRLGAGQWRLASGRPPCR